MPEYLNPNVSPWIADLSSEDARALAEKLMKTRGPQVSELPVKDLQAQLELGWKPGAAFLEPGSITPELLGAVPSCFLRLAASGAYATSTLSAVTGWTDDYDPLGMGGTTYITIPRAGLWLVAAKVGWQSGGGGRRLIMVQRNGSDGNIYPRDERAPGTLPTQTAAGVMRLTAGDTLNVALFHDNGSNINILGNTGGSDSSTFSAVYLGAA